MIDAGGYYHFRYPDLQFLFAYGHSVAGQVENYAYLGLYYTWGKDKKRRPQETPRCPDNLSTTGFIDLAWARLCDELNLGMP